MVDVLYLDEKIAESGKRIKYLAEKIGCDRRTFLRKRTNIVEFKPSEIEVLCKELGIVTLKEKDAIFFAHGVTK